MTTNDNMEYRMMQAMSVHFLVLSKSYQTNMEQFQQFDSYAFIA